MVSWLVDVVVSTQACRGLDKMKCEVRRKDGSLMDSART